MNVILTYTVFFNATYQIYVQVTSAFNQQQIHSNF